MEAIKIKDLSYSYKNYVDNENGESVVVYDKALNKVNLTINEGEFVSILGHNGSGKSTLAKMFNGLLLPEEGSVEIFGLNTNDKKSLISIRESVGMVFQNPDNQMVATIVEDDVAFGPENIGVPQQEIVERVNKALDDVGMIEYRDKTPYRLSGGQKQRIAIAGVLALLPKIIVFDESTAMLDPKGRKEIIDIAKKLNKEKNITIINITHFMDEAVFSDKVVVMNDGEIIKTGTPKEIFSDKETLNRAGLAQPFATSVANSVGNEKINSNVLTIEELAEELCQLL